jgi:hypothetical protein
VRSPLLQCGLYCRAIKIQQAHAIKRCKSLPVNLTRIKDCLCDLRAFT